MTMTDVVEQYTTRPAAWEDLPAIVELYNLWMIDQWGFPDWSIEEAESTYSLEGIAIEEYTRLWYDSAGTLLGAGLIFPVSEPGVRARTAVPLLPGLPDFHALGLEILGWIERCALELTLPRAPEGAKITMQAWNFATHEPTSALFVDFGMHVARQFLTMDIDLHADMPPPALPDGMTIRPLRYPDEARDAYRMTDIAFRDHYGHVDDPEMKNYDAWAHREFSASWFDPEIWFVAEVNGEPAGFAWCRLGMPDDDRLGWVNTLGVLPQYRRRGIATLLLQHAFREFYARGMHKAGLGVDATNTTGATRVYAAAGMHDIGAWNTYLKTLRDGVELVRE